MITHAIIILLEIYQVLPVYVYDKVAKEEIGTTGSEENVQEEEVLVSNTNNLPL